MKSLLFLLVAALAPLAHAGLPAPSTFTIRGHVTNFPDSTILELTEDKGSAWIILATDTVIDGHFSFTDTISSPIRKLSISSRYRHSPGKHLEFWVAPGAEIFISGDGALHPLWDVDGLPEQDYESLKLETLMPENLEYLKLLAQEKDLIETAFVDYKGADDKVAEIWPKVESLRVRQHSLDSIMTQKKIGFLEEMPVDTPWFEDYFVFTSSHHDATKHSDLLPRLRNLYYKLPTSYAESSEGKAIKQWINPEPVLKVGDMMADADLFDTEGNLHHLTEHAGRYILLDFWGSGCWPCMQSLPEMEEIISLYADSLSVVGISVNEKSLWQKSLATNKPCGSQWNEHGVYGTGLQARYGVKGIPHYVLIDPEGKIIDIWGGYSKGSLKGRLSRHLRK